MSHTKRRVGFLAALAIGLLATLIPAVPAADAAAAPWTWKRVTQNVSVQPTTSYAIRATCPAGYTAITGGLQLPLTSTIVTFGQYRQDTDSGSGWSVIFRNFSTSTGTATVVAECVETADLPPMSYNALEFARDGNGFARGSVSCLNPGEVVVSGGADWSTTSIDRDLYTSLPASSGTAWSASGRSGVTGSTLTIDVYCVNPAYVPGYQLIEANVSSGWSESSATCPVGKRILNGGAASRSYASHPNLNKWMSMSSVARTIRATCIDAGNPTVSLTYSSLGPNPVTTALDWATFALGGTDAAGFPSQFKCSLDGGAPTSCQFSAAYSSLASGPHEFVGWNTTADGRSSGPVTYRWTVDTVAPTVTTPTLPKATLTPSALAKWTGSDQHSSVDHYEAAYTLIDSGGTSTGWTHPEAWKNLGQSVQTPDALPGETVCVSVRAVDKALNASPWSAPACTTRPLDDRALTASNGWTRATGSAFWLNTVTRTTLSGKTLKRSDVTLNRVGILATECPGCGTVVVKVGDAKIGKINLDRATLANRKVRLLPAFTGTTGVVTIKSVTSGKTISIDGLVPIQAVTTPPPS